MVEEEEEEEEMVEEWTQGRKWRRGREGGVNGEAEENRYQAEIVNGG